MNEVLTKIEKQENYYYQELEEAKIGDNVSYVDWLEGLLTGLAHAKYLVLEQMKGVCRERK